MEPSKYMKQIIQMNMHNAFMSPRKCNQRLLSPKYNILSDTK